MKPKTLYAVLSIAGVAIPYWAFVPWLFHPGNTAAGFIHDLFANRISTFFALDLIVSAVVLLRFIRVEGARTKMRLLWLPMVATLCVGVSVGFPLFLYLREAQMEVNVPAERSKSASH